MFNLFKNFFPRRMVGVDIGTSSIKIVELSQKGESKTLENYAEIKSSYIYKEPVPGAKDGNNLLLNGVVSKTIKEMIDEARIKTKNSFFAIPDFSSFSTSFEIPPMPEEEIPGAIQYNASQYITLPIKEVTLDWRVVSKPPSEKNASLKVFLVAVPNQVIQQYKIIAKESGLHLRALEAEALGITRALVRDDKKTICLLDIGVQSSTVNIIDRGSLVRSYSFSFYSSQLSQAISSVLGVGYNEAEDIKNKEGIISQRQGVAETLYLLIDPLLREVKNISAEFFQTEQKQVEEIYLTGGTANLPGLKEYFAESTGKKVYVPNCFSEFLYPPILDENLKKMSPSFSVAVGMALGGLQT